MGKMNFLQTHSFLPQIVMKCNNMDCESRRLYRYIEAFETIEQFHLHPKKYCLGNYIKLTFDGFAMA